MLRSIPRNLLVVIAALLLGLVYLFESRAAYDSTSIRNAEDLAFSLSDRLSQLTHLGGAGVRFLTPQEAFVEKDGLVFLTDRARPGANPNYKVEHPILYLIRKAKAEWKDKLDRQSRDLKEAVQNYKNKYGRAPPKGFDKWYQFALQNKVILIDEYDQINTDILPFLGLPPQPIKKRSQIMIEDDTSYYHQGSFNLFIEGGKIVKETGGMVQHTRVEEQKRLLKRFVHLLPDMNLTIWAHDTSVMHLSGEKREELETLAKQGKMLSEDRWEDWGDPPEFVGWEAFCRPDSNMRNAVAGMMPQSHIPDPSFVRKHYDSMDFCKHPQNIPLHSLTGNYGVGPRAVNLWPVFSQSKLSIYADILVTPLEQFGQDVGLDPDWEQKTANKILWRGSATGSKYAREIVWRSAQRVRLGYLTNSKSKNIEKQIYTTSRADNVTLEAFQSSLERVNDGYFDIKFTGEPIQCEVNDGSCEAVRRQLPFTEKPMFGAEANAYKYIFDVDGNGWSGRFHRLMSSKSAVLKSTAFTEWWGDRVQPWVHYIPVKLDYSDLHSIASFFIGDEHSSGHDELAKEIGLAGKGWAAKHWRMQDMEAYMFRLYLEYARLLHRDPNNPTNWDFKM